MKQSRFIFTLAMICLVAWIAGAIHPVDREAWALENILVVLFVVVLFLTHRRLHLSNASWVCIALFILLHIVGAHYTYAKMPLGLWARDFLGFSRNHFDRVAHYGFGFFLAFPIRELLDRFSGTRRAWSFWLAVAIVLAVSGFFEVLESIVAAIVAPGQGVNWLGGQGDEWDAQNDMLSALLGAFTMMGITFLVQWFCPHWGFASVSPGRDEKPGSIRRLHHRFIDNRFLQIALLCYAVLWIVLAIHPRDRGDWFLENLLVFITAAVLISTYFKFQLSNSSYAFILIFLALHAIGAHYTYAKVPAGFWAQDLLHLKRNHYDRLIHFAFGFLLLYPIRELLVRCPGAKQTWAPWLAAGVLWALSSFFEIIEAIVAQIVRPDLGAAYLGTQGDIWDAQKDMAAAFIGALLVAAWLMLRRRKNSACVIELAPIITAMRGRIGCNRTSVERLAFMSAKHLIPLFVAAVVNVSFMCNADTPTPSGDAGIKGVITISPAQGGPTHLGANDSAPLANTTWVVKNETGQVATFTTDEQGRFQVSVPPGHYSVSKEGGGRSIGKFGPFKADVAAGKMTTVEWQCDSGMR